MKENLFCGLSLIMMLGFSFSLKAQNQDFFDTQAERLEWFRDAKFELEIGKVGSIRELADIVIFCQKNKFIPYKLDDQGSRIVLTATVDPFAEVAIQFLGMPVGLSYLNAIAAADEAFVQQIVKDARMEGQSRVSVTKSMVKGDDSNEIIIEEL